VLRACLTLLLAALLVSIFAIDPVLCPDGCGDEPIDTASAPGEADCTTCRGVSAEAESLSYGPAEFLVSLRVEADVPTLTADPSPIEHPPRPR
jgi:hypothetical protein